MCKPITPEQKYMIDQVAATMSIENMPLTEQCYKNLHDIVTGEKTKDEIIADIKRRYTHG